MPPPDTPLIESLAGAVARHGRDWCGDLRRCDAMLKDLIPERPREIKLLRDAVEAGVVRDLTGNQVSLPAAVLIERSIRRLHDAMGLREELARWTVGVWAVVLGIIDTMPTTPFEDPGPERPPTNGGMTTGTTTRPWSFVAAGFAVVAVGVGTAYFVLGGGGDTKSPAPRVTAVAEENSIGMNLVKIPAGEFEIGSNDNENEKPIHRVRITRAFLLGQTEVTQAQWRKVMDSSPWKGKDYVKEGADVAATYVSWDDAVEFCARLTKLEQSSGKLRGNRQYRLPTEAEWEYACRAGTKTEWSFGDDESRLGEFAWFDGNAHSAGEQYAHEVGQKKPNPWGLYDMHGNVYEWCSDRYDEKYYAHSRAADPEGPVAGSFRVIRGGSWGNYAVNCRSARRSCDLPSYRGYFDGFRVVLSVE